MTITKRVGGSALGGATKRVGSFVGSVYDVWARSWLGAWGFSWVFMRDASEIGHTCRVSSVNLLLLEGSESGFLLLSGDAQSGADRFALEGEAANIGGTQTKRVTI